MKKIFDQLNKRDKNIQVTNLSTKTSALKIRKKQICISYIYITYLCEKRTSLDSLIVTF